MMLNNLLQVLSPELIIQAIKSNPKVIMETLQKFDTFKLLGASLTTQQQITLSNNASMVNDFLSSSEGKTAVGLWAEEFTTFVEHAKTKLQPIAIETAMSSERIALEARIRAEVESDIRAQVEKEAKEEIAANIKAEIAAYQAKGLIPK